MKELTVTELFRRIKHLSEKFGDPLFCFEQSSQPGLAGVATKRLNMCFNNISVSVAPQSIHLINCAGSLSICDVDGVRIRRVRTRSGDRYVVTVSCKSGDDYIILCKYPNSNDVQHNFNESGKRR